jgi:hypothetical protein
MDMEDEVVPSTFSFPPGFLWWTSGCWSEVARCSDGVQCSELEFGKRAAWFEVTRIAKKP